MHNYKFLGYLINYIFTGLVVTPSCDLHMHAVFYTAVQFSALMGVFSAVQCAECLFMSRERGALLNLSYIRQVLFRQNS